MNIKELHDKVKNHPYRMSEDTHYKKSYIDAINDLTDAFYDAVKTTEYRLSNNMCHDMNYCTRYFDDPKHQHYLDLCIGVIHNFIDTGKVPYYYAYYEGVNHLKADKNPLQRLVYDYKTGKYRRVLSAKLKQQMLDEIHSYRNSYKLQYGKELDDEWGIYGEHYERYIRNAVVK